MFSCTAIAVPLPCELSQVAAVWGGRGGRDEAEEREASPFRDHPSWDGYSQVFHTYIPKKKNDLVSLTIDNNP